jgi:hypothetical protein
MSPRRRFVLRRRITLQNQKKKLIHDEKQRTAAQLAADPQ